MTLGRGTGRLESARLLLRRVDPGDFDFFVRLHADPEVARYLAHGRPRSPAESLSWLQSVLQSYDELGLGQLAVLRKSDGVLIGRCGLSDLVVEARTGAVPRGWYRRAQAPAGAELQFERELGYTFQRSSWGQGYASEAARCVLDYCRDELRLPRVVSLINPENVRSSRVAQRLGAQRDGAVEMSSCLHDRYVWPAGARKSP